MTLVYGSICSGIEAATQAWHVLGWRPKFFSEIEAYPSAVLARHHGSNMPHEVIRRADGMIDVAAMDRRNGVPNHGDFTKIPAEAGPVDLLVGGTPCQSFSVAGKRLGLDDPRGNLALEFLGLARRLRARWIVWENVPGVLSSRSDGAGSGSGTGDDGGPADGPDDDGEAEGGTTKDFATFLQFVQQCGYGACWRVLDAQYCRVDGYPFAVPQRRRRLFVIGHLGDWRPAAAVLLEPEGMRGDFAPRRKPGQGVAGTFGARAGAGGGLGTDFECDGGLIPVSMADVAPTLMRDSYSPTKCMEGDESKWAVAHALRADGFDASEDGTGRGTPLVAFSAKDFGADASTEIAPTMRAMPHDASHANGGGQLAVAYDLRGRTEGSVPEGPHDTANIRASSGGSSRSIVVAADQGDALAPDGAIASGLPLKGDRHQNYIVRRLTPRECERLQGFPDDHTRVTGWQGWRDVGDDEDVDELRAAGFEVKARAKGGFRVNDPDGPRYRALGNSMAVNVMRWIGMRIDLFERLVREGKIPQPGSQPGMGDAHE